MDSPKCGPKKSYYIVVSLLLCCALGLRLLAFFSLRDSIYFDFLLFDERIYHDWAVRIANGSEQSAEVYEFAPLFAYFMAAVYRLFAADIVLIRLANIIFGVLTCLVIGRIGYEMGGRKVGIFSLLAASVYAPMILYSIVPLKTSMSLLLFAVFVWLFLRLLDGGSHWGEYLVLGLVGGLMINVRPNYLIVLPAILLIALFAFRSRVPPMRQVGNMALLAAGVALAVGPFVLRNYLIAGEAALTVSQAGFNLYIGNNPGNPTPYYRPVPFASSSPVVQSIHFVIEAGERTGKRLSTQESSAFWSNEVVRLAWQHPGSILGKLVQKALAVGNRYEAGDHYHTGFIKEYIPFFKLPLLCFWTVFPLGMAGMVIGMFCNRKIAAATLLFALYSLSLVIFFVGDRYRLPLLVILLPCAAYGGRYLFDQIKKRSYRRLMPMIVLMTLFGIIQSLPLQGTDDMTAYYNTHALILHHNGKHDEALQYWQASSQLNMSYSAFADLSLARAALRKGDLRSAQHSLERIAEDSFAVSAKYEMLGDIMLIKGRHEEATALFRKALDIHPGTLSSRRKLITLLDKSDKAGATRERAKLQEISLYYRR